MAQDSVARLHRAAFYDGENGAAVAAEIPGASVNSGGTGQATLVLDVMDAGQQNILPNRYIVWTQYPNTPPNVIDVISAAAYQEVYGGLCDCAAFAELAEVVDGLASGKLVQAVTGTTDSNGNVSINWPVAFSGTPVVALGLQTSVAEVHTARITANSASGASVHVARSPLVSVLGINVTAAMVNASGVTVHAVAVGTP